ncbi:hypothetical protein Trco_001654 [Trichoderma cornu-damae]|uniref:Dopa 4,5-dioxygenase n=1 Tax=Trichoderma cornu-damae TaxID=654480 RepID=A0A9P8U1F5_9HYPO|nr:hypothetical protein Trco_001654 [Trichoderma cornu-damae]
MANPSKYEYPSPLAGFENAPPLSDEMNEDGRTFVNPKRESLSEAYDRFTEPRNKEQTKYARELWERIRREFPELRVYAIWDRPVGPHPIAMFEVNVFTPAQFGAFVSWLAIWRGPLSALVHPNTIPVEGVSADESGYRDHSQRAIWMGEKVPLDYSIVTRSF